MPPSRRAWLIATLAAATGRGGWAQVAGPTSTATSAAEPSAAPAPQVLPRPLQFPRDHGAHPEFRTEWWYATGWLVVPGQALPVGFQLTFFRSRTGLGADSRSRFAPRQLLFAHAAISDLNDGRLRHIDRITRWNGDANAAPAAAALDDTRVHIGPWSFRREDVASRTPQATRYLAELGDRDAGFSYALTLDATQPVLLQGDAGFSRKGPDMSQASHYYSQPQLKVTGSLQRGERRDAVTGTAWLDHEWSETLLHPQAVGWDWIGINLDDGSALTAFRLRRADGSTVWAGGSFRRPGGAVQAFAADSVVFTPGRHWSSPLSQGRYPVEWEVATPAGRYTVVALLDAQELDSRNSTGSIYWEGLSELRGAGGRRVGLGYLEMTGYVSPLRLG